MLTLLRVFGVSLLCCIGFNACSAEYPAELSTKAEEPLALAGMETFGTNALSALVANHHTYMLCFEATTGQQGYCNTRAAAAKQSVQRWLAKLPGGSQVRTRTFCRLPNRCPAPDFLNGQLRIKLLNSARYDAAVGLAAGSVGSFLPSDNTIYINSQAAQTATRGPRNGGTHIAHEMGHALGLPHRDGNVIMREVMFPGDGKTEVVTANDQNDLLRLHNNLGAYRSKAPSASEGCTSDWQIWGADIDVRYRVHALGGSWQARIEARTVSTGVPHDWGIHTIAALGGQTTPIALTQMLVKGASLIRLAHRSSNSTQTQDTLLYCAN